MELPKDLKDEIWEYCRLNDITDLNAFMVRMLKLGYSSEKYGPTPFKSGGEIEKEVIIEKIVEVPVEVIKEVEKIVEVPVEVIKEVEKIVEVPVEKIVTKIEYITDDKQENELIKKIGELEKIITEKDSKITELENLPPLEIIKEVEKVVEVNNDDKIKKLEQTIENLKVEIELEKNRNYQPKKREKPIEPNKNSTNNVISWVSKSERDEDIYNE